MEERSWLVSSPWKGFALVAQGVQSAAAMKTIIALFVCCISSVACLGQMKDQMEWGEKFNSAGTTLVLKELGRNRASGQTVVTYNLFVSGLPKDGEYTLWMRLVGSNPQAVADAFINKDGLVVSALSDPANNVVEDPVNLRVVAGRGEPKQFALIANNGRYRVFGQVVPFPIEKTTGTCSISATMMGQDYSGVLVVVTGLQSKEELQITQRSGNEGGQAKATAADDGTYKTLVFPFVKGQSSGKLKFTAIAKACSVDIEVPWGQGSYVIQ
jgi:hypothetical protein